MQTHPSSYRHCDSILTEHGNILWLGDLASASDHQELKKKKIKTVITCMEDCRLKYDDMIRHFLFKLKDLKSQNLGQHFTKCCRFIREGLKTGSVLVHCGAGVSRSATFVIAYLMKQSNMGFKQALRFCKIKRPQVCPNLGFEMQLKFYEKCLKAAETSNKDLKLSSLSKLRNTPNDDAMKFSLSTLYAPKRTQSLVSKRSTLGTSKVGFRITLKEFRG